MRDAWYRVAGLDFGLLAFSALIIGVLVAFTVYSIPNYSRFDACNLTVAS